MNTLHVGEGTSREPEPRARKMEDSGEPARPAVLEEPPHASEKDSATRKPAGDGKGKRSPVHKADDVKQKKAASKVDDDAANIATLSATGKDKKPEPVGLSEAADKGTKEEVHPAAHKTGAGKASDKHKHTESGQPSSPNGSKESAMPAGKASHHLHESHSAAAPKCSKPPSQTASDTVIKSKTGSQDEGTYQSHLSSYRNTRHERGAGTSSWNDVSLFSRKADDSGPAARKCDDDRGGSLLASSKSSIPVIQPVVQPLFSLYSSPYSSTNNVSGQPPAGPYAFGPSYPSYHAGPFYPGCLQRPSLGYNRPRMLLYNGQRPKSLGLRNAPCLEESESDVDDSRKRKNPNTKDKVQDDDDGAIQKEDHRAGPNKEEGKKAAIEEKLEVEKRADKKTAH
ncbi:translation initiation factor IF-2 isoform X2 [Rhipicephalus sanguineus]|uniref:translation initiation factor IF-2 isoform X2 n=1 Tax=Rhipicephalus sanguineus TaxID=34632 RepID=UPI0018960EE0|nr:translation initiation factor IF-2 isoform X2 [Rhipicephalus sanguineus]